MNVLWICYGIHCHYFITFDFFYNDFLNISMYAYYTWIWFYSLDDMTQFLVNTNWVQAALHVLKDCILILNPISVCSTLHNRLCHAIPIIGSLCSIQLIDKKVHWNCYVMQKLSFVLVSFQFTAMLTFTKYRWMG